MCRYRTAVLDEGIVGLMAGHYRVSRQVQAEQILKWDYDHMTATYFLLLARKQVMQQHLNKKMLKPFFTVKSVSGWKAVPAPSLFHRRH